LFCDVSSWSCTCGFRIDVVKAEVVAAVAVVDAVAEPVGLYTKTVWQSTQTTLTPFTSGIAKSKIFNFDQKTKHNYGN
jgi:hypothetical protein